MNRDNNHWPVWGVFMEQVQVGAHPASQDRAGHEPSQSSLSRPVGDHPIAQGRKDFTIADVLAWARTKPAHRVYDYSDGSTCAVAQFIIETGLSRAPNMGGNFGGAPWLDNDEQEHIANSVIMDAACGDAFESDWTFGKFVTRLEALAPEAIPTPSEWTRLDAYMAAEQVQA